MDTFSHRRDFIRSSATMAAGAALARGRAARASGGRPNILWLVSEDNSPWLGCYGDAFADTPNLDRLAAAGVLFTHAFANAPVCAPSRFTLHTGVYAASAGTEFMRSRHPIPDNIRFFTHHLRAAGYYCVNGQKTDYNTAGTPAGAWDARRFNLSVKGLKKREPFFGFVNYSATHESCLHKSTPTAHDPAAVTLAPYHPDTPEVRHDYAQYHDRITLLDGQIGAILAELEAEGLADNTIVMYFSDHGGALPRGKRFLYDSGMRVPLIVRVPPRFQGLCPFPPGSRAERMVSFIDFAPTVLSIAGLEAPDYMQGRAFLGDYPRPESDFVFGFRGRMDECYDQSRAARDRDYKYILNLHPHLPAGRHLDYLWKMPAMRSWENEYRAGRLNVVQRRFFEPKPQEELYRLASDPYEISNLASDPDHAAALELMRSRCRAAMLSLPDAGLVPEPEMTARGRRQNTTAFDLVRSPGNNLENIFAAAVLAGQRDPARLSDLLQLLSDADSAVRYWAAIGCFVLAEHAVSAGADLTHGLDDPSPSVAITAAEALIKLGGPGRAIAVIREHLRDRDVYTAAFAADALARAGLDPDPLTARLQRSAHRRLQHETTLNALL